MSTTKWSILNCLVLGFLLTAGQLASGRTPSPRAGELHITVWVYNYAEVHLETLAEVKAAANRIFRQAGIATVWVDCPTSQEEYDKYPACRNFPGPTGVFVQLQPRSLTSRSTGHSTVFGRAAIPTDGQFARQATVYAYGSEDPTKLQEAGNAAILGALMAHEIGHLLISTLSHSKAGIMQATWEARDLKYAAAGQLFFSTKDAERIQEKVLARMGVTQVAQR